MLHRLVMHLDAPGRFPYYLAALAAVLSLSWTGCAEPEPAALEEPSSSSSPPPSNIHFTDITQEAGLGAFRHVADKSPRKWFPEMMGSGCGFIDYNGDGWLDVVLVGGGRWPDHQGQSPPALWIYRNNGDGTFSNVTEETGLGNLTAYGFGVSAADYDNDGDQDLYFTTLHENILLRNDGGTFTDVTQQAGVAGGDHWSTSAIFFDADRDGLLDLYVGNYVNWSPENDIWCSLDGESKAYCTPEEYEGVPGRFYHNNGDGTFTDRTEEAGFTNSPGKSLGLAELDFNEDGWPDLAVANDLERDLLYVNDGDGTFTEKGMLSGIAYDENGRARAGMGIDVGVVDSTGEETIFVGNFSNEMIGVYRHMRNGLFTDRAALSKIGRPSLLPLTFGLFLLDVDLDRDLDLFAANGHVQEDIEKVQDGVTFAQPPLLFLNRGNGTFKHFTPGPDNALSEETVARGAAHADFDRDGDVDILVAENSGPVSLWRNDLMEQSRKQNNFLRINTVGRKSNRDGVGTDLTAVTGSERMKRRVRTGSSYLSQSEMTVTFGLEKASQVDSLIVQWPTGQTERFTDIKANQELRIVEGTGTLQPASPQAPEGRPVAGRLPQ